jgi:hypothetical protein
MISDNVEFLPPIFLRNYRTEFHETWWSYRYIRFVVKRVKAIFLGVQREWGLL